jgi:hypothetical protein
MVGSLNKSPTIDELEPPKRNELGVETNRDVFVPMVPIFIELV